MGDRFVASDQLVIEGIIQKMMHPSTFPRNDQLHGWNTEVRPKMLAEWTKYGIVNQERTALTLYLPASNFSIEYPEEVTLNIPETAVESSTEYFGKSNSYGAPGYFRFHLPALPQGTLFSSPGITSASRIRLGGHTIMFKLFPHLTLGIAPQFYQALTTYQDFARIRDGFATESSQATGFALLMTDWLSALEKNMFKVRSTTSRTYYLDTLTIGPLPPYPDFNIIEAERVQFRIADGVLGTGSGTPTFTDFVINP